MPIPSVTFRSELDPIVRKELDQLDGELTGWMLQEHDDDGRHTNITLKSLTVNPGPTTITGPLVVNGPITTPGPLTVNGPATVNGNLTVNGNQTINGSLTTFGNLAVSGSVSAGAGVYEYGRSVPMGIWQNVPFNAAHFFNPEGMTWTVTSGNVVSNRYMLVGKTLTWQIWLDGSTLGGTISYYVAMLLPGGFFNTGSYGSGRVATALVASTNRDLYAYWYPATGQVYVIPQTGSYAAGTFALKFTLTIEIQ